ncbi:metallophosphoesterase [Candidatus Woesearchaeota archaeon]|nr:metallophosphoesterase [Candidatus Woesearchaeota archaeon]
MKLLVFTDVHGSKIAIKQIINKAKEADLLICAGDLTNFGVELNSILKQFKETNKKMIIIPGNHESNAEINNACKKFDFLINIHLKKHKINDIVFFGFGTGGFSKIDSELEEIMQNLKFNEKEKLIFVSHGPPFGTKLDYLDHLQRYRGSKTLREFIKKFKPKFVVCGHLHENEKKEDKLNNTIILNPGKYGKIIEI